jgi:hypothetical protein
MTTMIILCCNSEPKFLEPKDWITIFSVIAIIIGWFVNGYLNRKNEIAKKRLDHRVPTLKAFLKVWFFIQNNNAPFTDPNFLPLVEEVRGDFQLYGQKDEIELFEKFIKSCETQDLQGANLALSELVPLVRTRIREELDINK